jgi:hypothetical protein
LQAGVGRAALACALHEVLRFAAAAADALRKDRVGREAGRADRAGVVDEDVAAIATRAGIAADDHRPVAQVDDVLVLQVEQLGGFVELLQAGTADAAAAVAAAGTDALRDDAAGIHASGHDVAAVRH